MQLKQKHICTQALHLVFQPWSLKPGIVLVLQVIAGSELGFRTQLGNERSLKQIFELGSRFRQCRRTNSCSAVSAIWWMRGREGGCVGGSVGGWEGGTVGGWDGLILQAGDRVKETTMAAKLRGALNFDAFAQL